MNEELKAALEQLQTQILTKTDSKVGESLKASLEEFDAKAKEAHAESVKALEEKLEAKFKADIKVVQDHADKLDMELQNGKGANGKDETFEQILGKAIEKETDNFKKLERKEKGAKVVLELDVKGVKAVGAVSTANVTGSTHWGAQARPGIIMDPSTVTHMRQLMNVGSAGPGTDYYFMRENGAGEGAPAPVAEGATKPQFDVDLVESSVKFETIAGWMLISRKALNNIPGITSYLSTRLPEKLFDVEDQQVLYGTGTSPQIKGILTSGNFVAGSAAGATALSEKIINDLSVFEDTYKRRANAIVMRPIDYWSFFKQKASGSGEYNLPQNVVYVNGQLLISGIAVARTTALTTGDYVIGDFANGADLLVQEAMRIEFFEQDSTNVRTNQVTVRIEETIAMPVYGSTFFMKGSSATS